jgi:hypothetical protein
VDDGWREVLAKALASTPTADVAFLLVVFVQVDSDLLRDQALLAQCIQEAVEALASGAAGAAFLIVEVAVVDDDVRAELAIEEDLEDHLLKEGEVEDAHVAVCEESDRGVPSLFGLEGVALVQEAVKLVNGELGQLAVGACHGWYLLGIGSV